MIDSFTRDLILEDQNIRRNEEMMREYSDRQFEFNDSWNESDYFDPFFGDIRDYS